MASYFCHPGCCPWKKDFQCSTCPVWLFRVLNWRTPTLGSTAFQGFCTTYTKCHNCRGVFSAAEQHQKVPLHQATECKNISLVKAVWDLEDVDCIKTDCLLSVEKKLCWSFLRWAEKVNVREKREATAAVVTSRNLFKSCWVSAEGSW